MCSVHFIATVKADSFVVLDTVCLVKKGLSWMYVSRALDRAFLICVHQGILLSKTTPRYLTELPIVNTKFRGSSFPSGDEDEIRLGLVEVFLFHVLPLECIEVD